MVTMETRRRLLSLRLFVDPPPFMMMVVIHFHKHDLLAELKTHTALLVP